MICIYIQWFSAKGDFLLRGKLGREAATALQCTGQAFITLICNRERERYDEREKERERERETWGGGRGGRESRRYLDYANENKEGVSADLQGIFLGSSLQRALHF